MKYVAFVHKDTDSAFGVSFPDFPGCVSAGVTAEEALRNAVEAVSLHAEGLRADGQRPPHPRSMEDILADPDLAEDREGATLAFVTLVDDRAPPRRAKIAS